LLQQIINGLVLGSMYALIALGYTMVYGIINLINFAHGEVLMVGALTSWTIIGWMQTAMPGTPGWIILIIALIIVNAALSGSEMALVSLREGQLARPVRVGDVFWVRGYHAEPGAWESVIDVTRAGRYAAKAAFLATASGAPLPEDAAGFGIAGATTLDPSPPAARPATEETPQPPPGPVAFPAV